MARPIKLDLTRFFIREGKTIIRSYKRLLTQGRGVSQDFAPKKKVSNRKPWLINTGETREKGFASKASKHRLLIYPSGKKHSGQTRYRTKSGYKTGQAKKSPTYRSLFRWHNRGKSSYNNQSYSGLFMKLPLGSQFPARMNTEVMRQLKPQIVARLKATLK